MDTNYLKNIIDKSSGIGNVDYATLKGMDIKCGITKKKKHHASDLHSSQSSSISPANSLVIPFLVPANSSRNSLLDRIFNSQAAIRRRGRKRPCGGWVFFCAGGTDSIRFRPPSNSTIFSFNVATIGSSARRILAKRFQHHPIPNRNQIQHDICIDCFLFILDEQSEKF